MKGSIVCIFATFVLISCATTLRVEPSDGAGSLLIGQLDLEALNFPYLGTATVAGKHTNDVVMKLRNLTTGRSISVSTQGELGIYYFLPEVGSRYQITELQYTNVNGGYTAVLVGTPSNVIFDVDFTGVTCLPKLHWIADDKQKYYAKIVKDSDSISQEILLEKYKDTKWNTVAWTVGAWK